ncbi:MAG: hypothetical protein ABEJ68_03480 [Halobacteriaceae archaeon]
MAREGERDGAAAFDSALAALGESGGAFLVCGDVPSSVHEQACERWLGANDRQRLVVRTEGTRAATATATETVTYETALRSAAAGTAAGAETTVTSLSDLGTTLVDAIGRLEARAREPGDIRVCVEAVDPLRYDHDDETVFRFLHLLVNRVRAADALAHVHLAAAHEAEVTRTFASLFDGTVALRTAGGVAQEQWHLSDDDITTEWLPVADRGER